METLVTDEMMTPEEWAKQWAERTAHESQTPNTILGLLIPTYTATCASDTAAQTLVLERYSVVVKWSCSELPTHVQ